jgi:hypothetical protein
MAYSILKKNQLTSSGDKVFCLNLSEEETYQTDIYLHILISLTSFMDTPKSVIIL